MSGTDALRTGELWHSFEMRSDPLEEEKKETEVFGKPQVVESTLQLA